MFARHGPGGRTVRVVLVHNDRAGGASDPDDVHATLRAAGHEIVVHVDAAADVRGALSGAVDLVAVAGGDGTVRGTALQIAGSGVPLAVIPLGTANNIAASLGMDGPVGDVVRRWEHARRTPFDMGVARGPWGERRFCESAGAGLVAEGIATMDAEAPHPEEGDRYEMLGKAVRRFGEVLQELRPRRCRLKLDGGEFEGELLLVEVLNIRSVGPRLRFAPTSQLADGLFDVVVAAEAEREQLAEYLRERESGTGAIRLPMRRAACVSIAGWDVMHLDDEMLSTQSESVAVNVERSVVEMLSALPD